MTPRWDVEAVRAALAAAGPGRFGASEHGYRLRPPLDEQEVRAFEQRHGVRLPSSYRAFLVEVADGGAGPGYGLLGLDELPDDEEYALHGERTECLAPGFLATPFPFTTAQPRAPRRVTGTLVIADHGGGDYSRLVVTGPCAGQVWSEDQTWAGLTPGPDFHAWYTAWLWPPDGGTGPVA